jgi:hypothetical protein
MVPLKPLLFSKRDTLSLGRWKAYFYRRPKDNEVKRLRSRLTISDNLFSDSIQSRKNYAVKESETLGHIGGGRRRRRLADIVLEDR